MRTNHKQRPTRYRDVNLNGTLSAISGPWDRTVCFSDIRKWMQCPGMYLMWKEGDAIYRRSLSQEIGDLVHQETAKPAQDRLQDTAEIAARLKNVRPEELQVVAQQVKALIAKAVRVSDKESIDAIATQHERLMVWYDSYTNTFWYAQADKMEILEDRDGKYLSVVDQKTGTYRKALDVSGAFFFGYVAKMTKALNFDGPIKTMVRYLKDFRGQILARPFERWEWIGRHLKQEQKDMLWSIQETVKRMDADWQSGEFRLSQGNHCRGCQFRHTCPVNKEQFAEELRRDAERQKERETRLSLVVIQGGISTPVAPMAPPMVATTGAIINASTNGDGSKTAAFA
ncbi:MAG: PD-(D/E)XK nuclease family protein [Cyanobacteria bacterium SZAS LIN-3]|nr:PD-(D/E)XK nuclease family protein [Cyanobacteria bacterium SZAS LIN-3]